MVKQTWVSVFGNVRIDDGKVTHVPISVPTTESKDTPSADGTPVQPPHAVVRSNLIFEQGTISWEAMLGESNGRVQLMLPTEPGPASVSDSSRTPAGTPELSVGLNVLGAPYGFANWNGAWEAAGGAGHGSVLPVGEWIQLKVIVRGSEVELYVQGVWVLSTRRTLRRGQIACLLQGNKEAAIRNVSVSGDAPTCFVVMQFTDEFDVLYRDVIRPVCESYGYKVVRGDDFYSSGQIMEDVTQSIKTATLIIADVTPDNANVFYEVGFAHAIGKPTILLSDRKRERLPFDISGFRTLFYDDTIGGKAVVEARLKQHLDAVRPK
jgi:hypothetical protein